MIKRYKTKPCEIEALEYTGNNLKEVLAFMGKVNIDYLPKSNIEEEKWYEYCSDIRENGLYINTLEGDMLASIGDYIIKGLRGEFYPCKPDVFNKKYENKTQEEHDKINKIYDEMIELTDIHDNEIAHEEADKLLCDALKILGHEGLVVSYSNIDKWYS